MLLPPAAVFFFIFIISGTSAEHDHQQVEVKPGQSVSMDCPGPAEAAVLVFYWRRSDLQPDGYLLFYRERRFHEHYQHRSFRGRVEEVGPSAMKEGNFSVVLRNVSTDDAGIYECLIKTKNPDGGHHELKHSINLTVSGKEQPEERGEKEDKEENSVVRVLLGFSISTLLFFYSLFFINIYLMNRGQRLRTTADSAKEPPGTSGSD